MTAKPAAPEPLVHLGLSHYAAERLQKLIEDNDGYIEDERDAAIFDAIRTDIKEQLPAKKAATRRKKK
jgi:hypothetical protein